MGKTFKNPKTEEYLKKREEIEFKKNQKKQQKWQKKQKKS